MQKKTMSILENYLNKYKSLINGADNSGDKIVEFSLYGVGAYENIITSVTRGKINLTSPNKVSEILRNNDDYSNTVKQIYCNYFPSFKITNPLAKLAAILVSTSAVVADKNKHEYNNSVTSKLESLPPPENNNKDNTNNKDRLKEEQKKKDEMFLNEFDKSINKK